MRATFGRSRGTSSGTQFDSVMPPRSEISSAPWLRRVAHYNQSSWRGPESTGDRLLELRSALIAAAGPPVLDQLIQRIEWLSAHDDVVHLVADVPRERGQFARVGWGVVADRGIQRDVRVNRVLGVVHDGRILRSLRPEKGGRTSREIMKRHGRICFAAVGENRVAIGIRRPVLVLDAVGLEQIFLAAERSGKPV